MDGPRVVRVDERDSNWEDDHPRFRVYLQRSGQGSVGGWTDTYDITGADVLQVIDWAQRRAGEALTYAIALVRDDQGPEEVDRGRGLIWLVGVDGNDRATNAAGADAHRRMLARREHPVGIPPADAIPSGVVGPHNGSGERSPSD